MVECAAKTHQGMAGIGGLSPGLTTPYSPVCRVFANPQSVETCGLTIYQEICSCPTTTAPRKTRRRSTNRPRRHAATCRRPHAEEVARELHLSGWQKLTADALVEHVQQDWRQIEAAPLANAGLYLQMKYPEMRPAGSVPTLHSMHGIGTGFYGSRDPDRPTGSYVKTQCFCIFFIPIFALKAYRVTSRGSGWNLIGRVPLSRFAKTWNIFFSAPSWRRSASVSSRYLNSPSLQAGRKLARADQAAAAGKLLEASRLYAKWPAPARNTRPPPAQRCAKLVQRPEIDGMPMGEVTQIFDEVLAVGPAGR